MTSSHEVLDVLYNHVGITGPRSLDFDLASWTPPFTVNTWVSTFMTQQMLPLLRRSPSASIIFTASQAGISGVPTLPIYASTKGAIIQFMKSVALMLAPEGIRANAICPGATDSEGMRAEFPPDQIEQGLAAIGQGIPMGRVGQPEEMSTLALFLASDASKYLTGAVIPVDGGATAERPVRGLRRPRARAVASSTSRHARRDQAGRELLQQGSRPATGTRRVVADREDRGPDVGRPGIDQPLELRRHRGFVADDHRIGREQYVLVEGAAAATGRIADRGLDTTSPLEAARKSGQQAVHSPEVAEYSKRWKMPKDKKIAGNGNGGGDPDGAR